MAAIRVLHVITQLAMGGAENQLLNLCRQLPGKRYDQRVASLVHEGVLKASFREAGTEVLTFDRERLGGRRAQMRELVREIRRSRPDIVQTWLRQANNLGRTAGLLAGRTRLIATFRDMGFNVVLRDNLFDLGLEPFTRLYLHNSAMGREAFLERLRTSPRRKHRILPNGIDPGRFHPDPSLRAELRRERGLGPEDAAVLMVSRLHPIKDPWLFLEVARRVRRRMPGVQFWLVGGGPLEEAVREKWEKEPDAGIWLAGERQDVPRILSGADLAMLTSRSEGLSNSILEAMSASLPVLATDVGGNRELVLHGETGWLSESRDPQLLADRVLSLLADRPILAAAGGRGRARVETSFSMETMSRRAESFYEGVMRGEIPPDSV